ncbi:MAG: aspartate aminotransferase family protein [Nitrososphaerales archaeon]|nr:aspartate aminotransferase family protein [Nitrososphaerales archaeon]
MIPQSVEKYQKRTPTSKMLFERAVEISPGGVHHNIRYYPPYPLFFERAKGSRMWDVDGNEYIDFWMGHGSLFLGHAPDAVVEALKEQCAKSTHYGMPSKIQIELGELVKKMAPWVERIRFANTGTEATMYAVRFARAYTKKRKIVKFIGHWHGGHDILNVAVRAPFDKPSTDGSLRETAMFTITCRFNDIEGTLRTIKENADDLACVIVEPVTMAGGALPADREFLKSLREVCDKLGIVLIFDEVVTGFRLAKGGATEVYGIIPDLLTYGKIIGGGCPAGAIAGKKEIMEVCDPSKGRPPYEVAQQGGTFCGNPMTMVAGYVTLKILNEHPEIYTYVNRLGDKVRRDVDRVFNDEGIPTCTTGLGSMFMTHFLKSPGKCELKSAEDLAEKTDPNRLFDYHFELMNHGIFFLPKHLGLISSAHTEDDINRLISASQKTAELLKTSQ